MASFSSSSVPNLAGNGVEALSTIELKSVTAGQLTPDRAPIQAGSLWAERPALVYVVRRPGCVLCREDAQELTSRIKAGQYDNDINVVGVIKEVAPIKGAETDEKLGVGEFQSKYFQGFPLFLDQEKKFYSFLGDKSLLSQPWRSWNPFTLYSDFQSMNNRLKSKGVEGNLRGEGLLKGGLLVVHPTEGVVYRHEEMTGFCMPYDEVIAVLDKVRPSVKSTA
eukprot:gene5645-6227_t